MVEMSVEPLVVSPKTACVMLDIGPTKLWGLINAGELESFLDGARRKITTRSIKARIARGLEVEPASKITPRRALPDARRSA